MSIRIHAFPPSPRAFKVLCLANHLGIDYQLVFLDMLQGAHRGPDFAAINPNMRMPVLEEDGFCLWESNAILQYLASKEPESGVLPLDERDRADVSRWQFWDSAHWDPACAEPVSTNRFSRAICSASIASARCGQGPKPPFIKPPRLFSSSSAVPPSLGVSVKVSAPSTPRPWNGPSGPRRRSWLPGLTLTTR